jgi:multisubunit Na+/H+ antiporter MnhF subunit
MLVRTLLGIDLLVALVVLYFFVIGLADGSVSSFNMSLWLGLLAAVTGAVGRRPTFV